MKFLSLYSVILCASFLCTSCTNDYHNQVGIIGQWQWELSAGGWGTYTPESTGIEKIIVIDQRFYSEYHNDSLVKKTTYEIRFNDDRIYGSPDMLNVYNGGNYIIRVTDKNLILDQSYSPDAPSHYYHRVY